MGALKLDQILEGDCVERMKALPAGCADLIFADPPRNSAMIWLPNCTCACKVTSKPLIV